MFQEWGFLLGEIWVLLVLAALIGLLAGWIIWGRASSVTGDVTQLRNDLDACRRKHADKDARIAALEDDLSACEASRAAMAAPSAPVAPAPMTPPAVDDGGVDYDGDGIIEGKDEGSKPMQLDAARGGKADDLKMIKGIGPK
ncbi:MAG: hypothetical protein AAF386_09275, partial [Pseudomonadota bacterium]